MRIPLLKLTMAGIMASIFVLGLPIFSFTSDHGIGAGAAFADSRDKGHLPHDRGQDTGNGGGW